MTANFNMRRRGTANQAAKYVAISTSAAKAGTAGLIYGVARHFGDKQ
jgi:hypothetical protein